MRKLQGMELLGYKVKDKITGAIGIATSISFDLYGCVQALVNPGLGKDGKPQDLCWFDTARLEVQGSRRVMEPPEFSIVTGPEAKPLPRAQKGLERR